MLQASWEDPDVDQVRDLAATTVALATNPLLKLPIDTLERDTVTAKGERTGVHRQVDPVHRQMLRVDARDTHPMRSSTSIHSHAVTVSAWLQTRREMSWHTLPPAIQQ